MDRRRRRGSRPNGYVEDVIKCLENAQGTAYSDRLYGTSGNNVFKPGAGSDIVYGEGGSDTVDYSNLAGGVFVDLGSQLAQETVNGASMAHGPGAVTIVSTDWLVGISNIVGTAWDDRLYGTSGNNVLTPGAGNDIVYGEGGSDTIDYSSLSGGVYVDLASGTSSKAAAGQSLWNGIGAVTIVGADLFFGISNAKGTNYDDRLYGTSGNNVFTPGAGSDIVYGQGGSDTVDYSNLSGGIYVDLGSGTVGKAAAGHSLLGGIGAVTITGTDWLIGLQNVVGTDFGDRFYVGAGSVSIWAALAQTSSTRARARTRSTRGSARTGSWRARARER